MQTKDVAMPCTNTCTQLNVSEKEDNQVHNDITGIGDHHSQQDSGTQMFNALIASDAGQSVSPSLSLREEREENQLLDADTGMVQMANNGAAINLTQHFLRLELKLVTSLKELIRDA